MFFGAAGLMVMLGAEYIAMITIIVYVGAVLILFLFVIMMLDVDVATVKGKISKTAPFASLCICAFLCVFFFALQKSKINSESISITNDHKLSFFQDSARYIGKILYTDYILEFQISGLILFLAMVGSITLLYRKSHKRIRRQNIMQQVMRKKKDSIELVDVNPNDGVKL
jgi:NADH-quinone oxidoreductase subunit J